MSDETDCEAVHRAILTVAGQPTGRSALHGASDDPELEIAEALLAELGLGEMHPSRTSIMKSRSRSLFRRRDFLITGCQHTRFKEI